MTRTAANNDTGGRARWRMSQLRQPVGKALPGSSITQTDDRWPEAVVLACRLACERLIVVAAAYNGPAAATRRAIRRPN